jgi:uncharacterized protein YidB (DUF937 family)
MFEQLTRDVATRLNVSEGNVSALLRELLLLFTNEQTGGIDGFADRFQRAGLGSLFTSWFAGKSATPIAPAQVEAALGAGTLDRLAAASGLPRASALAALAALLPGVIAQLTAAGRLPSASGIFTEVSSFLKAPAWSSEHRSGKTGWPAWLPWAAAAAVLLLLLGWWFRAPSGKRADAVRHALIADGVPDSILIARGPTSSLFAGSLELDVGSWEL